MRSERRPVVWPERGFVVLAGPPCSGKSAAGRILGADWERRGWHYISVDAVFDELLPGSARTTRDRILAYDAAHAMARSLFSDGRVPILECTYSRRWQRSSLATALAEAPGASLRVVEFTLSPEEAVRRFLASAAHQATDLTEQLVRERATTYPYSPDALRLQSQTNPPETLALQATNWLLRQTSPVDLDRWVTIGNP